MTDRELLNLAKSTMEKAYVPYTGLAIGAAIECGDGSVFTGCTVENAAPGNTLCAELVAIGAALSGGRRDFRRIAIVSDTEKYPLPCGKCRQVLMEFSPDMELLCAKAGGSYVSYKLRDLLPLPFSQ